VDSLSVAASPCQRTPKAQTILDFGLRSQSHAGSLVLVLPGNPQAYAMFNP